MGKNSKKGKKQKEKKPITIDRAMKWLMPIFIIVIIIFSGYQTYQDCGFDITDYQEIQEELTNSFDVNTFLSGNKIISSDKQTLKEKLGHNGVDLPIFIQGEISYEVFNNQLNFNMSSDLELTDCEFGVFVNAIVGEELEAFGYKMWELTLEKKDDNCYNMTTVVEINLSDVDLEVDIDLSGTTSIYLKSESVIKLVNNKVEYVSSSTQLNGLSTNNNDIMVGIINSLFGCTKDMCSELVINLMNDFALKTSTNISLAIHKINFINR